jgi:hypothetical protein
MAVEKRDWRDLCEAASKEHDSDRLIALVSELMDALDKRSPSRPEGQRQSGW